MNHLKSNEELLLSLDTQDLWLVRNGFQIVPAASLRAALEKAFEISMQDNFSGPIVKMPNDEIVIDARQVYSLWHQVGLKTKMETA